MSTNAGLNAIYSGGFAQGIQLANTIGLGRKRHYHHHDHHHDHHAGKRAYHHHDHHHDRPRRRHGRGFMDMIKKGIQFAKDNQLASKALKVADSLGLKDRIAGNQFGALALKGLTKASEMGYGRRRRHAGRRRRHTGAKVIKIVIAHPRKARGRRHKRRHY
jgi:hypothetical protein